MKPIKTKKTLGSKKVISPVIPTSALPPGETILFAVTGMSPAILTETIWALAVEQEVVPDRVIILTTSTGSAEIKRQLFTESPDFDGKTVWDSLRGALASRGFNVKKTLRDEQHIFHRWDEKSARHHQLDDIRDLAENEAAADFILEKLRAHVETPNTRVIASIAGGRKTMGALLFSAMSLIGRETDRITHVLVQEPFEAALRPGFYYPEQPCQQLELLDRDRKTVLSTHTAASAKIQLATVPFVPLRNLFEETLSKPAGFTELVARCQRSLAEIQRSECTVSFQTREKQLSVNGVKITLTPPKYLLLHFLASRALKGQPTISGYKYAEEALQEHAALLYDGRDESDWADWRDKLRTEGGAYKYITDRWITRTLSELRTSLKKDARTACLVHLLPQGDSLALDLKPRQISIQ